MVSRDINCEIDKNRRQRRESKKFQKTSIECGQFAEVCPGSSQSSQNASVRFLLRINPPAELALSGRSSLSRSHVKISCPGCSQISHTSSPSGDALSDIVVESDILLERDETDPLEDRASSGGPFDVFFWLRLSFSFSRSTSRSSSSSR